MASIMATINICRGLRKLEFESAAEHAVDVQARVEFSRSEPLEQGVTVHVPLGLRDGKLRALIGVPRLLEKGREDASREYLYRLSGPITESFAK
jgi:hypothetical protein